jgi:hypothetical protein
MEFEMSLGTMAKIKRSRKKMILEGSYIKILVHPHLILKLNQKRLNEVQSLKIFTGDFIDPSFHL